MKSKKIKAIKENVYFTPIELARKKFWDKIDTQILEEIRKIQSAE